MSGRPPFRLPPSAFLRIALLGLIAVILIGIFASRFVLIELNLRRLGPAALLALAEALAILGVGRFGQLALARVVRAHDLPKAPRLRIDFLIGYPLFGAICFLVGLISTSPPVMAVLLVLGVMGGTLAVRTYTKREAESFRFTVRAAAAFAILAAALFGAILVAQLPAVSLDEVAYHLAVPHIWVNEGRVVDLPLLSHSYFPFGIESADLPLLSLLGTDGAIASHFVHVLAAIAAVLMMYSWLRRRLSEQPSLIMTAAIATTPALLITAGWSWNEWPLVGLCVALLSELEDNWEPPAIAALIAAGMLTKYSFPLFALVLLLARREKRLVMPAVAGMALGSVFIIRNIVLTGNPFAPFLSSLAPPVSAYRSTLSGYIFEGAFLDESLGLAILILGAAALVFLSHERFLRDATVGLTLAAVLTLIGMPSARLLLPFLVPLALIGALSFSGSRTLEWIAVVISGLQFLLVSVYFSQLQPFEIVSGRLSDAEYVGARRAPVGDIGWIDAQLPADSRTLVLGVNELFWFSHRVRGGGNFDANRISHYLSSDLGTRLREDQITHVAVVGDGLRVGAPANLSKKEEERITMLNPDAAIRLREFLQTSARLLASRGNSAIYAVNPPQN